MRGRVAWAILAAVVAAAPGVARAQDTDEGKGFSASLQAGLSSGQSATGALVGGALLVPLGARVSLEASGAALDRGHGATGTSASASLLVHLRPRREDVVPYLALGGGLYRVSFDRGEREGMGGMDGRGGSTVPGMFGGTTMPYGPGQGSTSMPQFYANRMNGRFPRQQDMPFGDTMGRRTTFNDPSLSVGGGIRIGLRRGLFLRPDARALVVFGDGDTSTVGLVTVNLGYRF